MRDSAKAVLLLAGSCFGLAGCVSVPAPDYSGVEQQLQSRLPGSALSLPGAPATVAAAATTTTTATTTTAATDASAPQAILLTPDSSLQLALQHNQALQAELLQLGIAQADVVQAGLLANPTLAVSALDPDAGGRWQLDLGLSQSVLDLMTRSLRQTMARSEQARIELLVSERLLTTLQEIRIAYFTAVAAQHKASIAEQLAQAASNSASLARQFYAAGNISELEQLQERTAAQAQQLLAGTAEAEARVAIAELARQLGVADSASFQLPAQLPDYPRKPPACGPLQQAALEHRLDLQQQRLAHAQAAQALALYEHNRGMTELEVGVAAEREFDGQDHVGPSVSLSLPVFDQGQARIAAQQRQAQKTAAAMLALEASIPHEVQQACVQLEAATQRAERLRTSVIPHRERIVVLTQREYNYMLVGAEAVLQAKQDEYQAYLDYVEAVGAVWVARSRLGKTVGSDAALGDETPVPPLQQEAKP